VSLDDKNVKVQRAAIISLGRLGKGSSKIEEALKKFDKDEDPRTRSSLVIARAFMDKTDPASIPVLIKAAGDPDKEWSEAGTGLLRSLARDKSEEVLPGVIKMLEKGEKPGTINAMKVLRRMKGKGASAVPLVQKLYNKGDAETRKEAIYTITYIDRDGDVSLKMITKALSDSDKKIRKEALISLMKFRKKPDVFFKPLLERLKDKDKGIRLLALAMVRGLSSKLPEAVPQLIVMTKDPDDNIRAPAIRALGSVNPPSPEIIAALSDALKDKSVRIRRSAVRALGYAGLHQPTEIVPILEKADKTEKNDRVKRTIEATIARLNGKSTKSDAGAQKDSAAAKAQRAN
jgi:HEAT repeat protein